MGIMYETKIYLKEMCNTWDALTNLTIEHIDIAFKLVQPSDFSHQCSLMDLDFNDGYSHTKNQNDQTVHIFM